MLEPIALPSASPLSPFLVATIEVTSSGRDVPIATIVRPMKFWLTPKLAAMIQALSTTRLPPNITAIRPVSYTHLTLPTKLRRQRQMCIRDRYYCYKTSCNIKQTLRQRHYFTILSFFPVFKC